MDSKCSCSLHPKLHFYKIFTDRHNDSADKYSNLSQDVLLKNIVTIDANFKKLYDMLIAYKNIHIRWLCVCLFKYILSISTHICIYAHIYMYIHTHICIRMYIDKCISIYNILIKILRVTISCSYYTPLFSKYSFIIKNSFFYFKTIKLGRIWI